MIQFNEAIGNKLYVVTPLIRYVRRDGERVLQQFKIEKKLFEEGVYEGEWFDVEEE